MRENIFFSNNGYYQILSDERFDYLVKVFKVKFSKKELELMEKWGIIIKT